MDSRLQRAQRIHCVGIGGVGMSGIAEVLLTMGHRVSGSDIRASDVTRRLALLGAQVFTGHDASHVSEDTDVVVISSAVRYSNPEVVRARELNVPVIPRGEMLAELMRMKQSVVVGGSHGKTTTTSLIGVILARAGFDPTAVIGGIVRAYGSNVRLGRGELLVAEADESDGSFLLLSPAVAVVTNIDGEHLDHYGDLEKLKSAFTEFVNRVPFYGRAVLGLDSPNVRAILPRVRKRFITYGTSPEASWTAREISVRGMLTRCVAYYRGRRQGDVRLGLPGRHHAVNALGAIATAAELGVPFATAAAALEEFGGIHRRFELCGEGAGVLVVSDYAHHPAEIRATIAAAREGFDRRIVVVFQPHRYSRTRDLFADFLPAFDGADTVLLTEIYAAGEPEIEGISGRALCDAIRRRGHADIRYEAERSSLVGATLASVRPGDLVLVLGAGDVHELGESLVTALGGGLALATMQ